ncbi:hypothetical protein POTOM_030787 [Populus tomentosa]|uniref:Phospholipid-transporting ATPase n=1 Tax=Populus tomentosa TaxID=118781 RepID=A0A8X7Z1D4_POPTO|nr:hypothetical protein POTOM_030787 [Populus tomentosa]
MDSRNPFEEEISLNQRKGGNSVREVRHGSRGGDIELLGLSQKEIGDDDARLVYLNDPVKSNERYEFAGNSIRTSKYSVFSFLPRNLFRQFHRVAYIYFLIIAVLNQLPQLAVFGRGASIMPLAFVLSVTAVKDAYEDWRRHRSDRVENNRLAWVLVDDEFRQKKWKDIQVGEILKIQANETFPCDIVLLSTSEPTGVAFVQTVNLDGESNLKTRYAKQETISKIPGEEMINGLINVVSICAAVWLRRHKDELDILPFYRRKDFAHGAPQNFNYYGWGLEIFFTFLMSVIVFQIMIPISLYISMELVRVGQAYFMIRDMLLYDEESNSRFQCRSLNINEDLGQIKYVFSDKTGTLTENKMEFQRASIWGVDYSDGRTVSRNDPVQAVDGNILQPKMEVKVDPQLLDLSRSGKDTKGAKHVHDFLLALAACNTIVPLVVDDTSDSTVKLLDYQGESPDEQALAYAAAAYGFMLTERTSGHIVINIQGERQRYLFTTFFYLFYCQFLGHIFANILMMITTATSVIVNMNGCQAVNWLETVWLLIQYYSGISGINISEEYVHLKCRFNVLGLHEFDSDRKRMSVILGCPDKTVKVFVKGADTSMFSVIDRSLNTNIIHATEAHLQTYSSMGLRTLVFGIRELNNSEFEQWHLAFEAASTAIIGRAALLRKVANNVENSLTILGASAIEDKLQQGVPEAIESLRTAGIKAWVLTGDKQETAISIGYSSKLLTSKMTSIIINSNSKQSSRKSLEDALVTSKKLTITSGITHNTGASNAASVNPAGLIIDGTSLVHILDSELEELLFELASKCSVVLCCRVAPLQKAGIVALVKNRTRDMTLAIGDGDFPTYVRSVALCFPEPNFGEHKELHFVDTLSSLHRYVIFTSFTLTTAITEWSSMLYSIIYTALPTIVVGILDKDLSRRTLLKYPQLYGAGHRQEAYNSKLFWLTMIDTLWQSVAVFSIPLFAYWASSIDGSSIGDLWTLAVVILVNLHLAMDIFRWSWITHAVIWGSIIATFICVIVIDAVPIFTGYWAIFHVAKTELFWLCLLAIVLAALIPRYVVKLLYQYYSPCDIQIAREAEKFGSPRESRNTKIETNPILGSPHR